MIEIQEKLTVTPLSVKRLRCAMIGLMLSGTVINFLDVLCKLFFGGTIVELTYIVEAIGIIMFLVGMIPILSKRLPFLLSTTLAFVAVWGLTALLFKDNVSYMQDNIVQFFVYTLPFCWIGYELAKTNEYLSFFLKVGRVKLVIAMIAQIIIFIVPETDVFQGDYMNAANEMIVGVICVYHLAATERSKLDIFLSVVATAVLMICGSRGVFISLVCYWILFLIFGKIKNKIAWIVVLAASATLLSVFFNPVLEGISKIAESVGFSTHLIDALLDASLFDDEIRVELFENFWRLIVKEPFGYGVLGDRHLSLAFFHKAIYPHNLFLELMIDFGYIGGSLISLWVIWKILQAFFSKNNQFTSAIMVLFSATFVKLMVSGSFWDDQIFFLMIGICLAHSAEKKKDETEDLMYDWYR